MTPRAKFFAYVEAQNLDISEEIGPHGCHVTVHAPEEHQFSGNGIDIISLWDGERSNPPDWADMLLDLKNHMPLEKMRS